MMGDLTYEIAFDDAKVPAENLIGNEGDGMSRAQTWITAGRLYQSLPRPRRRAALHCADGQPAIRGIAYVDIGAIGSGVICEERCFHRGEAEIMTARPAAMHASAIRDLSIVMLTPPS